MTKKTAPEAARASLELLYEVSREFAAALDLRTVLHRVLFLSMKHVGASSGSIIVLDETGQPVESAILVHGRPTDHTTQQLRVTYDQGLAGWVARHRQAVLAPDTSQDERWLRLPDDAIERSGPKSAVSAPIQARENLVGVITLVHPTPQFFTHDHLALVQALADQAGNAIRHAQLYENLQIAHRRYQELFEVSLDPIVITNWQGTILEVNRQAALILGQDRAALPGCAIQDFHPLNQEKLGAGFDHLASGELVSYEGNLRLGPEREIPVRVNARSFEFRTEILIQWVFHDISESRKLDRLREDLAAMIYHDLRSPLTNVASSLSVLESFLPIDNEPLVQSVFGIAQRSVDRILRLTNSLLDINRLEAGQPVGSRSPVRPAALLTEALEAVKLALESRKLKLETVFTADLPPVLADPEMIRRVLINLLENAIKFSPAEGKIELGARRRHQQVWFWVKDQGPGIPLSDRERVFEKFTQLGDAQGPRGLGIGLAFCKLAVEGHGGKIWVESEPDTGSCFCFTLPVANEAVGQASATPGRNTRRRSGPAQVQR